MTGSNATAGRERSALFTVSPWPYTITGHLLRRGGLRELLNGVEVIGMQNGNNVLCLTPEVPLFMHLICTVKKGMHCWFVSLAAISFLHILRVMNYNTPGNTTISNNM
jgi:hypothetical protein